MSCQLHLWTTEGVGDPGDRLECLGEALLDGPERARFARFLHSGARRQFVIGRYLLRTGLSALLPRVAPKDWRFEENSYGAPHVAPSLIARLRLGPGDAPRFNLSHTNGLVVLGITPGRAVGVDVEDTWRNSRTVQIADRFFSQPEVNELRTLSPEAQRSRFFDYWTLKESYIKARGMGLAIPLRRFGFMLDGPAPRVWTEPTVDDRPERWWFKQLYPSAQHRIALCLGADGAEVEVVEHVVEAGS